MSTAKMNSAMLKFGPDDVLIGSITESAQAAGTGIGAIIWGMGMAEVQIARRFARLGIVTMQMRIGTQDFHDFERRNSMYDRFGVEYCKAAMDKLTAERGVTRFLLMGNCAQANLCFNTAVVDPRTIAIILTNPHFSEIQILSTTFHRKLFRWKTWRRLIMGKTQFRSNLEWLGPIIRKKLNNVDEKSAAESLLAKYHHQRDAILPADFDDKLALICRRGIDTLIVFANTEDSLGYLKKTYQSKLDELMLCDKLSIEVLETDSHVFNNDRASSMLNERIALWAGNVFGSSGLKAARPATSELQQSAHRNSAVPASMSSNLRTFGTESP